MERLTDRGEGNGVDVLVKSKRSRLRHDVYTHAFGTKRERENLGDI
jgi:hypothetical protein